MAPVTAAPEAQQTSASVSSPVGSEVSAPESSSSGAGGSWSGGEGSSGESSGSGEGSGEGSYSERETGGRDFGLEDFDSLEDYAQALIESRQQDAEETESDEIDSGAEGDEESGDGALDDPMEMAGNLDEDEAQTQIGLSTDDDDLFTPRELNERINSNPELRAALEKSPEMRSAMFRNARLAAETSRYKEFFPDVESARYAAETAATFRQLDDLFLNATTPQGTGQFLQKWAEMSVLADEQGRPLLENGVPKLHPAFTSLLDNIRNNELSFLRRNAEKEGDQELMAALDIITERTSPASAAQDELPPHIRATAAQIKARETELNRRQLQQQHAEHTRFDREVGDESTRQINALIEPALQKAALTDFVRQTAREKIDNAIVESLGRNRFFQARMAELSRYPLTAETRQQRVNLILSHVQSVAGPIVRRVLSQATAPVIAAQEARRTKIGAQAERSRTEPRSTTGNFAVQTGKSPEQLFEQIKADYTAENGEEPSAQKLIELWTLARRRR